MTIEFNRTGAERKALVEAMGEILKIKPKYLGMPTAAYEVDYFTIDKNGSVEFDDRADSEEIENLLEELANRGFAAKPRKTNQDAPEKETANDTDEGNIAPQGDAAGLTVAIPLDKVHVGNLTKLLDAKGNLIKKALGVSELPIEIGEDRISFPWFPEMPDADEVKVYTHFIGALCEMAKNAKRVTATEKEVDNEKYTFRCFLLRLGFIGAGYKLERKILLKNLSGSSAFKRGERKEVDSDAVSE